MVALRHVIRVGCETIWGRGQDGWRSCVELKELFPGIQRHSTSDCCTAMRQIDRSLATPTRWGSLCLKPPIPLKQSKMVGGARDTGAELPQGPRHVTTCMAKPQIIQNRPQMVVLRHPHGTRDHLGDKLRVVLVKLVSCHAKPLSLVAHGETLAAHFPASNL